MRLCFVIIICRKILRDTNKKWQGNSPPLGGPRSFDQPNRKVNFTRILYLISSEFSSVFKKVTHELVTSDLRVYYFTVLACLLCADGHFLCPKGGGHPHGIQNPGHHR